MDRKIIIREIDKLVSTVSPQRVVTEFIIYYMVDGIKVEAHTELGDESKKIRVNEMLLQHFSDNTFNVGDIDYPIEEVSFKEVSNEYL